VSHSESELIERARLGDTEAFCALAQTYERRLYSLAFHYTRDPHDAEDLSQEVWIKAYRGLKSFRGESSFYTWLRQITINSFLNYKRGGWLRLGGQGSRSAAPLSADDLDALEYANSVATRRAADMEDDIHRKMLVEKVMQALGELTAQQRLIFLLKHHEGMTYEEISREMNCSTGTIKKSLFRAVLKLRQHLGVEVQSVELVECAAGENC
jgi:RNA polymerase sigma-70 factor (ECF subfamily)